MDNKNDGKYTGHFSKKLRAGRRRTYFFDVRSTKQGDYFLTITESKKRFEGDGYESHKIFLYKEDFNKFVEALNETVNYVKTDLLPDFDYDAVREERQHNHHNNQNNHKRQNNDGDYLTKQEKPSTPKVTESKPEDNITPTPQIADDEQMDWN